MPVAKEFRRQTEYYTSGSSLQLLLNIMSVAIINACWMFNTLLLFITVTAVT